MITPFPLTVTEPGLDAYDWVSFGSLDIPLKPQRFGFQLDLVPPASHPQVVFGLLQRNQATGAICGGFGVRVDLDRGEIWDLLNDSGLVGWLEHPLGLAAFSEEEPLLLSWEVERMGAALIPKLQIGGEEWLYPSVRCTDGIELTGLAGCSAGDAYPHELFLHPALWREELGQFS